MAQEKSNSPNTDSLAESLDVSKQILEALQDMNALNKKLLWEAQVTRRTLDTIRTTLARPVLSDVHDFINRAQLSFLDTLKAIKDGQLSFSRFGDGEMRLMLREDYKLTFQKNSPQLALDLKKILTEPAENLLVGFPHLYRDNHWSGVWSDIWDQMKPLLRDIRVVGNSHVSRPVFFQHTGQFGVEAWRDLWEQKKISIITGKDSRFELIPELFDNASQSRFMYSAPKNAYEQLEAVRESALQDDSDLTLISLGPAGSVLAYWLAKAGKQAIDIGHISDSYQNVFKGGSWPETKSAVIPR